MTTAGFMYRRLVKQPLAVTECETAEPPAASLDADLAVDRDRIAAALNGSVIHGLFAASLSLHGALALENTDQVHDRVRNAIDELDQAIKAVRDAVFDARTT